ncbi:Delta-aminolevulinic acid dehydratase [Anaerohalosphaera lusitana]|uniref:Delta-aminolevulinic acid dehydratase n=2 Tax=Anaerohalosphaera lusitana TaxID=1936003 RepID=A0A1U9NIU7_9BACT|nr:porphobilinogen synthase [Anaerohalosphaera lusitana]AQT67745.1 Delta-aminolevulinic acid dehydratase [Anaerohalosphaera lusitana]
MFPTVRMRRLRNNDATRRLVRETTLNVDDLVYPLFVCPGESVKRPIKSMPGCFHFSPDKIIEEAKEIAHMGIPAIMLFGLPETKDPTGSDASNESGPLCNAIRNIKKSVPELLIITDVCLCAYTDHGHCGVISNGKVDNDRTIALLAKTALAHANAGADMVAPSDMMDGRVNAIRRLLDEKAFEQVGIMSYSAKFASAYYGPFRDAAGSSPAWGDRRAYQMDPANGKQAMREMQQDIEEGADIIMVKPALAYLDIIANARRRFDLPIAAYNVSGEYMMLNAAAEAGLIDHNATIMETMLSFKRAGTDIIITYFAKEVAKLLQ